MTTPLALLNTSLAVLCCSSYLSAAEPLVQEFAGPADKPPTRCLVYAPVTPEKSAGLVVHLYGSGGSLESYNVGHAAYDNFRQLLAERGYWLVVPDLGLRHWMNDEAVARVDAVIEQAIEKWKIPPDHIHLHGSSMGGASSLVYVLQRPEKIRSVVAVFPITDFPSWLEEQPGYRGAVETAHQITPETRDKLAILSPLQHPEKFRHTAVYLLHGDKDRTVLPRHSREFAEQLKKLELSVTYREVAGEVHRDEIAEKYQQEMADFLTKPVASE